MIKMAFRASGLVVLFQCSGLLAIPASANCSPALMTEGLQKAASSIIEGEIRKLVAANAPTGKGIDVSLESRFKNELGSRAKAMFRDPVEARNVVSEIGSLGSYDITKCFPDVRERITAYLTEQQTKQEARRSDFDREVNRLREYSERKRLEDEAEGQRMRRELAERFAMEQQQRAAAEKEARAVAQAEAIQRERDLLARIEKFLKDNSDPAQGTDENLRQLDELQKQITSLQSSSLGSEVATLLWQAETSLKGLKISILQARDMKRSQQLLAEGNKISTNPPALDKSSMLPAPETKDQAEELLRASYANYIEVRECFESRKGYSVRYINEPERDDARVAVKRIEDKLKAQDPNLNTDEIWASTSKNPPKRDYGPLAAWYMMAQGVSKNSLNSGEYNQLTADFCKSALRELREVRSNIDPESAILKKDF
jgi:hypothetical protein